ncbi:DNA repair protein, partial [Lactobacillus sp. XV13L]|nr:DNA repair protein [Lactobacillus sp. XV13L]
PSADLNVFFGANEAGKSTVVAFIKQVLFGFHLAKHTSDFFEDYKPLARVSPMGGSLFFENDAGERYELERLYASGRGSKVGTLTVKCDNQVVPEHVFFDQVKNIDGAFYADSFIFNQDMLAKVSAIGQSGLLERIYYLGASNSDKLIGLRDDFAKQAGDLFKKGGSKPPLNRLLSQLREEKDAVSEAEGEFATYQSLSNEYEKQKRLQTEHEQRLLDLQKQSDRLQRLQQLLPNYRELTDLEAQVEPVSFDLAQYQS